MEQLGATRESNDIAIEALRSVVIGNYELKILYPELFIDYSTKKKTVLRQASDDLAVDCKRYTVLKCHVANYIQSFFSDKCLNEVIKDQRRCFNFDETSMGIVYNSKKSFKSQSC